MVRFRSWLIEHQVLSESEIEAIEAAAKAEVQDAFEFADASPAPEVSELLTDVYEGM